MKIHFKRIIAPALLIMALWAPLVTTEAQSAKWNGGGNHKSTNNVANSKPPRRVQQATLTEAQIIAVLMTDGLKDIVTVSGMTIRPKQGISLWKFASGGYAVLTDSANQTPGGFAAQVATWNLPNGHLRFAACWCSGRGGNDNCKFKGGYDAAHCGGQHCCGFASGEMDENGVVVELDQ